MRRLQTKNNNTISTEKQQKHKPLLSGKIDKHEYLTGEKIPPSDQRRVIEQAKFTYSSSRKALKKQTKTIEDQGKKQIKQFKAMENNWLNLMNLLKRILISKKIVYHLKNQKNI